MAGTSLLTHSQGNFRSHWVTAFAIDLPDTGQHRAKHLLGKVTEWPKKGRGRASPGDHIGVHISALCPFWGGSWPPSSTLCVGLLSPTGRSAGLHGPPGTLPGLRLARFPLSPGSAAGGPQPPGAGSRGRPLLAGSGALPGPEHLSAGRRYTSRLEGSSPAGRSQQRSCCKQCGHRQRLEDGYK